MAIAAGNDPEKRAVVLAMAALGFFSVITQLAVMRELLGAFTGNELVLGIVMANWFLLSGLGAMLGKIATRSKIRNGLVSAGLIVAALIPPVQIISIRLFRDTIFGRGVVAGLSGSILSSFLVLLPFCLISGCLLPVACGTIAYEKDRESVTAVYAADSLGSMLGGLAFSFWLVRWLDHFAIVTSAAIILLLATAALILMTRRGGSQTSTSQPEHVRNSLRRFLLALCCVMAVLMAALLRFNIDGWLTQQQFAPQQVVFRGSSPYGTLVVTETAGQFSFIYNGMPVVSSQNQAETEETADYAMAQRPEAKRVLLVGGGISGTAREILRFGVETVDYVELDPLIIEAGRKFMPTNLADNRIHAIATDGRTFIRKTSERFDAIILDLPDPSTSQINRLYTAEFFAEARRALNTNGVLVFSIGGYENFVSPELSHLLSSAHLTLKSVFRNVLVLPGSRVFFLASDGELTSNIAQALETRHLQGQLVNRHYLDAMLSPDRIADMQHAIEQPAKVNRDFSPVLYFQHVTHWSKQFRLGWGWLPALLLIPLAIGGLRLGATGAAILVSGFTASALQLVLLLALQILNGALYREMGIVVAVFMAALALGAFLGNRLIRNRSPLQWLVLATAMFAFGLPFILQQLNNLAATVTFTSVSITAIAVISLVLAVLIGAQFPVAAERCSGQTGVASGLYTADFMGACLGALLASTLMIPMLGILATCFVIAALNLVAAGAILLTKG